MKFLEMIEALMDGKQAVRSHWEVKDGYLTYMLGMPAVWKVLTQPNPNAGNHLFTIEDFLAEDWQIAEVKKFKDQPSEDKAAEDKAE